MGSCYEINENLHVESSTHGSFEVSAYGRYGSFELVLNDEAELKELSRLLGQHIEKAQPYYRLSEVARELLPSELAELSETECRDIERWVSERFVVEVKLHAGGVVSVEELTSALMLAGAWPRTIEHIVFDGKTFDVPPSDHVALLGRVTDMLHGVCYGREEIRIYDVASAVKGLFGVKIPAPLMVKGGNITPETLTDALLALGISAVPRVAVDFKFSEDKT